MSLGTAGGSGGSGGLEKFSTGLADLFYPVYRRVFDDDSEFIREFQQKLKQARMTDTVEVYLSRTIGVGVLTSLGFLLFAGGIGFLLFVVLGLSSTIASAASAAFDSPVPIPPVIKENVGFFLTLLVSLVGGVIGFWAGFITLFSIPYLRASARKREINLLLTDVVSFMYSLSVGGLNQLEIVEAVAEAEDTYGEASKEFRSITNESEYFDTDYRTAIRQQSIETPSNELAQFLTDMLSIIDSGGDMTEFLRNKKDRHLRTARKEREQILETLELLGEMYMTLALAPLLLIIIFVIMGILNNPTTMLIFLTVYAIIPIVGVAFLGLISTIKVDDPGDGYIRRNTEAGGDDTNYEQGVLNTGLVDQYTGDFGMFSQIKTREVIHEIIDHLKHPHVFFRQNPLYVLIITVPASVVVVAGVILSGSVPTTWSGVTERPVWSTFAYANLPLYLNLVPLGFFYEWNVQTRRGITNTLSDDLRQLASANNTGMTLLQSIRAVSETSSGKLASEFEIIAKKVEYGNSLEEAMVEFNNKYHIPRLARTIKLITKAEEASNYITDVLSTAAQASENADDINRERKSRTRMQVAIIIMTYVVLLGVMALLKVQFVNTLAEVANAASGGGSEAPAGGGLGFSGVNPDQLSTVFLHAVMIQAIMSGIIAGYIRDAELLSGIKYMIILQTLAIAVWAGVELAPAGGVV
jgi:flagellar protein FlaJ